MIKNTESGERTNIEKNVMRRVHTVRVLRVVFSGVTASFLLLLLALYGIGREVWVARVFTNGPQDFFGHFTYLSYAFTHTRLIVQVLTLLTLASIIYLARSFARTISSLPLIPVRV